MTVKIFGIIIYFIVFILSLGRIIYFSKNKKKESKQEIHIATIFLAIFSLVFGISLIILSYTTDIDEKIFIGKSDKSKEFNIDEEVLGEVYNISNIKYSNDSDKYIVTILLSDESKKLIEVDKNLIIYDNISEDSQEYIELYKDSSLNKVYIKNSTLETIINTTQPTNIKTIVEETNKSELTHQVNNQVAQEINTNTNTKVDQKDQWTNPLEGTFFGDLFAGKIHLDTDIGGTPLYVYLLIMVIAIVILSAVLIIGSKY